MKVHENDAKAQKRREKYNERDKKVSLHLFENWKKANDEGGVSFIIPQKGNCKLTFLPGQS